MTAEYMSTRDRASKQYGFQFCVDPGHLLMKLVLVMLGIFLYSRIAGLLPVDPAVVDADLVVPNNPVSLRTNQRTMEMRNEERYLVRSADTICERNYIVSTNVSCMMRAKNICQTENASRMKQIVA